MSDFMNRASLAGAVDLSSLRNKANQTNQVSNAQDAGVSPTADASRAPQTPSSAVKVPSLIFEANEGNLNQVLQFSNSVPVIFEFYADWSEHSKTLTGKLAYQTQLAEGRILLARVDVQAQAKVAAAFKVEGAPTVVAVMKGQPVPLFSGDQDAEAISKVFERVLEVAVENGMLGVADVDPSSAGLLEPQAPPLSAHHQAAFEAIEAGEYERAASEFQAALNEKPSDSMAKAGLAQAKLLARTAHLDIDTELAVVPSSQSELLRKADVLVAIGHSSQGYQLILDEIARVFGDDREPLRKHLVELFEILGPVAPEVIEARKRLALLLY